MNFEQPQERKVLRPIQWVKPDPRLEFELGEIERVAKHFGKTPEDQLRITSTLTEGFASAEMVDLTTDLWKNLENTDSSGITTGDYATVRAFAEEHKRDDGRLINRMNTGLSIEAPVIAQFGSTSHLVSGNTRLMLARAAGQTPRVVIIPVSE